MPLALLRLPACDPRRCRAFARNICVLWGASGPVPLRILKLLLRWRPWPPAPRGHSLGTACMLMNLSVRPEESVRRVFSLYSPRGRIASRPCWIYTIFLWRQNGDGGFPAGARTVIRGQTRHIVRKSCGNVVSADPPQSSQRCTPV